MSKNTHSKEENTKGWRVARDSEITFAGHLTGAIAQGFIKKAIKKATAITAAAVAQSGRLAKTKSVLVGNRAARSTKGVGMISTGARHSPIREQQDASRRSRVAQTMAAVVLWLCRHVYGVEHPHVYMATYTIPNVKKGGLDAAMTAFRAVQKQMRDDFKTGARRGSGGIQLPATITSGGGSARWLGDYTALELTVNKFALAAASAFNLFHPHIHQILITDKPLDMYAVKVTRSAVPNMRLKRGEHSVKMAHASAVLFKWWAAHNPQYKLSPKAFFLEEAYQSKSDADDFRRAKMTDDQKAKADLLHAFVEASKYAIKPDLWKYLPKKVTDYSVEVFAEAYNAVDGKSKLGHGIFNTAAGFLNFCNKNKLESAVFSAYFDDDEASEYVPDLFTRIFEHEVSGNFSQLTGERGMTTDQRLWFNRDIIGGSGFDATLIDKAQWPDTEKGKLYHRIFKHLCFADRGKAGLLDMLDNWVAAVSDILTDIDATKSPDAAVYYDQKLQDTIDVRIAVDALLDDDGDYTFKTDWTRRGKCLNVLVAMDDMAQASGQDWSYLDTRKHRTPTHDEKLLLDMYGRQFLCGCDDTAYLDRRWAGAYRAYKAIGHRAAYDLLFSWTHKTFDAALNAHPEAVDVDVFLTELDDSSTPDLARLSLYSCLHLEQDDAPLKDSRGNVLSSQYSDCVVSSLAQFQKAVDSLLPKPKPAKAPAKK